MRRATASVSMLLLLCLAGCGGAEEDLDPAAGFPTFTTSPTSSASPTSATSGPTAVPTGSSSAAPIPEETTGGPVAEESDHVPGDADGGDDNGDSGGGEDNGGGGAEDERVIDIGGPTLDNTFPNDPFNLEDVGAPTCTQFTNGVSSVTVTVRSVRLVNHKPANDPGLALGANPASNFYCTRQSPHYPDNARKTFKNCVNARLEPAGRTACPVEVRATGKVATKYTATLVLRLSAVCTQLKGQPCSRLSGRAKPTASNPVTVVWSYTHPYAACLIPRGPNGYDEEAQRRCRPGDFTEDPAPSSEPGASRESGSGENSRRNRTEPTPSTDNG